LPDSDILTLLGLACPAFLVYVVWTVLSGEAFGTGATVAAAIVILAPALFVSAWRSRIAPVAEPERGCASGARVRG
jgi:hypothetical protein